MSEYWVLRQKNSPWIDKLSYTFYIRVAFTQLNAANVCRWLTKTVRRIGASHANVFERIHHTCDVATSDSGKSEIKKSINWKIDVNNYCLCLLLFRQHWTLSHKNLTPLFKRLNGRYEWLHIHGIKISHYWCSVKRNVILQYGYIRVFFYQLAAAYKGMWCGFQTINIIPCNGQCSPFYWFILIFFSSFMIISKQVISK